MDTPDKAAGLSDSQVADAINKDWLLASAQSCQLSAELRRRSIERSLDLPTRTRDFYGSTQAQKPLDGRDLATPPACETNWLRRNLWTSRRSSVGSRGPPAARGNSSSNYVNNAYTINGHLYDNISFADSPLLRSLTSNKHEEQPADLSGAVSSRDFCFGKFRLLVAAFVLLGITLANYSRNALSLAAVGMIASNAVNSQLLDILADTQTTGPPDSGQLNSSLVASALQATPDGSCPVLGRAAQPGAQLLAPAASRLRREQLELEFKASIEWRLESGELVDWTPGEQGLISAAGSVGNLLIAIPLTRMGEVYGPKWIIFLASLGATIQAALMPLVSTCSVPLVLLFQLIFNGLTYGADCVAYTLFAHWLTPTEMAFFVSCLIICYQLGTMMSSFVTAKILSEGLAWAWCFYTPAILCGVWTCVWALIGASEPAHSELISSRELLYLLRRSKISSTLHGDAEPAHASASSKRRSRVGSAPVSWWKLARDPNIWAIIAIKFTLRWYFSTHSSLMPTYLASVAHMSVATIGTMSVVQSFIGLFSGLLMGYLTRSLVTRRLFSLSLATTRKCFQSVVNFGLALSLLVFIIYDCDQWVTIISLTVGGFCVSFYVAAALQIPLDLSPAHCGLITSITNTLALGQALGAPISGLILNGAPKGSRGVRVV